MKHHAATLLVALSLGCGHSRSAADAGSSDAGPPGDGGPDLGPDLVVSGSRLRARWQVAAEARRLIGWHDNQLGVDCTFEPYIAGRHHRCIPEPASYSEILFADPACSQPVAQQVACATPGLVIRTPPDSCAADPTFFAIGSALPASSIYQRVDGGCSPTVYPLQDGFTVGGSIPESQFVSATERPGPDGQLWLDADDGARMPWGGWDGTRAVMPTSTNDGATRWGPWMVSFEPNYTWQDSACTVVAAGKGAGGARCPLDAVLIYHLNMGCSGIEVSFAALGPPLSSVYMDNGGPCVAVDGGMGILYNKVGAPIPTASLAQVSFVQLGNGAVQVEYPTLASKAIRQAGGREYYGDPYTTRLDVFVDSASGMVCDVAPGADGVSRCLPAANPDVYYLDAACSRPALVGYAPTATCPGAPAPARLVIQDPGASFCAPGNVHVFPVAATAPVVNLWAQLSNDGGCVQTNSTPNGETSYAFGPELPAAQFAPITIEVD